MIGLRTYVYCAIAFDGGRTYYYRTFDKGIRPGDKVIVPVGKINARKVGTVVATEFCNRRNAPYPVRKTKQVISLAGKNAEKAVERYNKRLLKSIERKNRKQIEELAARSKRQLEMEWIDRIEELDALLND